MGFFLLGRDGDGVMTISPGLFATRQEALAELSRLSAEGGVPLTDEVFVVDLDAATPVLLVAQAPVTPSPAEEPTAPGVEDDVRVSDASVWEAPVEPEAEAVAEPVEPAVAEAVLADLEDSPVPDVADQEAPAAEEPVALHDALKRAAGALESDGIVAPESVGPVDTPSVPAPLAEAADAVEAVPVPEPAPESTPASWPWDVAAAGTPAADASDTVSPAEEPQAVAEEALSEEPLSEEPPAEEPLSEEPGHYVPDPFEEPAPDVGGPLIHTAPAESGPEAPRTVVMGAYAEEERPTVVEPASVLHESPAEDSAEVPAPEPEHELESGVGREPEGEVVSDLLADLEELPVEGAPAESGLSYEAGDSDLDAMTCDDCVYLNTCPKRGESDPSTCGSFQWRTV